MAMNLSIIFSSSAKTSVLETLNLQTLAMGLRQISSISSIPVRSVELAIKDLQNIGLVRYIKVKKVPRYLLNTENEHYLLIKKIFQIASREKIRLRSNDYSIRAKTILPFIVSSSKMIDIARRNYRGVR